MIPDIQVIFDAGVTGAVLDGPWFYVGKYSIWNLQISGLESGGTVTVEVSSVPGIDLNNSGGSSSATPVGIEILSTTSTTATPVDPAVALITSGNILLIPDDDVYVGWIRIRKTVAGGSPTETIVYISGEVDS